MQQIVIILARLSLPPDLALPVLQKYGSLQQSYIKHEDERVNNLLCEKMLYQLLPMEGA